MQFRIYINLIVRVMYENAATSVSGSSAVQLS